MQGFRRGARGFLGRAWGADAMPSCGLGAGDPALRSQLAPPNCKRGSDSSMVFNGGQATVFISLNACR